MRRSKAAPVNYEAKDLGKALGKLSQEQARIQENIYPDDPDAQLLLQVPETITLTEAATLTRKDYADNVFILDHPVYGDVDSSTLLIDGDYAWQNYDMSFITHYSLDGDASAANSSTFDGSDANVSYAAGILGSSANYNGSTAMTTLPASNVLCPSDNSWSVACWFNADSIGAATIANAVLQLHDDAIASTAITFRLGSTNQLQFRYRNSGGTATTVNIMTVSTGVWYFVVATYDGTDFKVYVNGNLEETITSTFNGFGSFAASLGAFNSVSSWYDGKVDEVSFWSRVLSSGEISDLYNSGVGRAYDLNHLVSSVLETI